MPVSSSLGRPEERRVCSASMREVKFEGRRGGIEGWRVVWSEMDCSAWMRI